MKTMVDLGSNFFMKAKMFEIYFFHTFFPRPSTEFIFVNVGLNFQVQFTIEEAIQFIEKKESYLIQKIDKLSTEASIIKANMKIMTDEIESKIQ
jgi:hypothetical protein